MRLLLDTHAFLTTRSRKNFGLPDEDCGHYSGLHLAEETAFRFPLSDGRGLG
jgi:hypothetical protein